MNLIHKLKTNIICYVIVSVLIFYLLLYPRLFAKDFITPIRENYLATGSYIMTLIAYLEVYDPLQTIVITSIRKYLMRLSIQITRSQQHFLLNAQL